MTSQRALDILAAQNATIRDLNANSDQIIGRLAARQADVVRFIQNARDTAATSAERRDDLSRNFDLLDDFLHQLRPTLVQLGRHSRSNRRRSSNDLRAAAPGLNTLAADLPAFNSATEPLAHHPRAGGASRDGGAQAGPGRDPGPQGLRQARLLGRRRARQVPARHRQPTPAASRPTPGQPTRVRRARGIRRRSPATRPDARRRPATPASRACSTTSTTRPGRSTSSTPLGTCCTSASSTSAPAPAATTTPATTRATTSRRRAPTTSASRRPAAAPRPAPAKPIRACPGSVPTNPA